jgi:PAS domain S-box-containing protein
MKDTPTGRARVSSSVTLTESIRRSRRRPNPRNRDEPIESRAFESFLVDLSDAFVQRPAAEVLPLLNEWLTRLARLIAVDRIALWEIPESQSAIVRRFLYAAPGCEPPPTVAPIEQFRWLMEQNRLGKVVAWSHVPDDIPEEARSEIDYSQRIGAKSLLSIPVATDSLLCVLAFTCLKEHRCWSRTVIRRLRLVSSILAGAVMRERAEGSLRASEAKNRAIVEALPDLLFVMSSDGVYLECYCPDQSELLLPPEQFLGRRLEECLPPDLAASFRAALARVSAGSPREVIEYSLVLAGEKREYEARLVRRDDGAIVSIVRNVTQVKRETRLLHESEARFRGAFHNSAIGMAVVGLDGRWLQTNPANCRILGYSEEELRSMNFQELTHPDDLGINLRDLQKALDGDIDHYQLEKRYIHKDGRVIPALLTVSVVRDDNGRALHFVSQLQDLTERRNAQVEIERLHIELARFGRAALTGQLTASLAHQLMQPLSAAIANAQACRRMMAMPGNSGEIHRTLEDIERNCGMAARIIDGVRKMLRKEPGPRHRIDFNELVRGVLDLMRAHLALRHVTVLMELEPGIARVSANPIELQQVILNLVLNAAEALQSAPEPRTVIIDTATKAGHLEFSVSDSGPGVEPEMRQRIFEPFFTTKSEGIGMGLTICADIIRAHGGRIWADANGGGGLAIYCVLPLESSVVVNVV